MKKTIRLFHKTKWTPRSSSSHTLLPDFYSHTHHILLSQTPHFTLTHTTFYSHTHHILLSHTPHFNLTDTTFYSHTHHILLSHTPHFTLTDITITAHKPPGDSQIHERRGEARPQLLDTTPPATIHH